MRIDIEKGYFTVNEDDQKTFITFSGAVGYTLHSDDYISFIYMTGVNGQRYKITDEIRQGLNKYFVPDGY